jgi:hypothetical protein
MGGTAPVNALLGPSADAGRFPGGVEHTLLKRDFAELAQASHGLFGASHQVLIAYQG